MAQRLVSTDTDRNTSGVKLHPSTITAEVFVKSTRRQRAQGGNTEMLALIQNKGNELFSAHEAESGLSVVGFPRVKFKHCHLLLFPEAQLLHLSENRPQLTDHWIPGQCPSRCFRAVSYFSMLSSSNQHPLSVRIRVPSFFRCSYVIITSPTT